MNNKKILNELNLLLSRPANYYKQLIIKNNLKFDFKKPVIIFGAGKLSNVFIQFFKKTNTKILALSDNNNKIIGTKKENIKIINKNTIKQLCGKDIQIVVTSVYYSEIYTNLIKLGLNKIYDPMYFSTLYQKDIHVLGWKNDILLIIKNKKRINSVYNLLSDNKSRKVFLTILKFRLLLDRNLFKQIRDSKSEYFDKDIINLSDKETFLDGGAYDGDTMKMIIKESKNRFNKIFAFEPDYNNYSKLANYTKKLFDLRIKIYKFGLGKKKETLYFSNEGNQQSKIINEGKNTVRIIPIDKFKGIHFTYIKLDIEGYEKKALIGAKNTLKNYKPKLAICAYHRLDDMWEVPLLIKKLQPNYKIYFRHYTNFILDTICYAV